MSYSQKRFHDDQALFPGPPQYLLWREDWQGRGEGQVRHVDSLAKVKKNVGPYIGNRDANTVTFDVDWSVYEWDHAKGKWVRLYQGFAGDRRNDNQLWFDTAGKNLGANVRDVDDDTLEETLASIREAM